MARSMLLWAILIGLVVSVFSACTPNSSLANTESAIIQAADEGANLILKPKQTNSAYTYLLTQPMATPPQVAVGLTSFDVGPSTVFSFVFLPLKVSATSISFGLKTYWNQTQWVKLKFSVLASAKTELELGSVIFQNISGSDSYSVAIVFRKPLTSSDGYIVRPFVAGLQLNDISVSFDFKVDSKPINTTHCPLTVTSTSSIASLVISYILFSPGTASFVSYGSNINIGTTNYITGHSVQNSLNVVNNFIFGIISFKIADPTGDNSIYSNLSPTFLFGVMPNKQVESLVISYILLGPSPKTVCAACPGKLPYYGQECLYSCKSTDVLYTYPDGSRGCISCDDAANMVKNGSKCVCKPGYILANSYCHEPGDENIQGTASSVQNIQFSPLDKGEADFADFSAFDDSQQTTTTETKQEPSLDDLFAQFPTESPTPTKAPAPSTPSTTPRATTTTTTTSSSTKAASDSTAPAQVVKPTFAPNSRAPKETVTEPVKPAGFDIAPVNDNTVMARVTNSPTTVQASTATVSSIPSGLLCPSGYSYDSILQGCVLSPTAAPATTPQQTTSSTGKIPTSPTPQALMCPSGYYYTTQGCQPIPQTPTAGTTSNQYNPQCTSGRYWNGEACVPISSTISPLPKPPTTTTTTTIAPKPTTTTTTAPKPTTTTTTTTTVKPATTTVAPKPTTTTTTQSGPNVLNTVTSILSSLTGAIKIA